MGTDDLDDADSLPPEETTTDPLAIESDSPDAQSNGHATVEADAATNANRTSSSRTSISATIATIVLLLLIVLVVNWLNQNDPESKVLARLEEWRKEKSQLALAASGERHYRLAWAGRGSGYSNTVTGEGWQIYSKHMPLAMADLDAAIAMGDPPLASLDLRIQAGLELDDTLEDVDPLCRQASELYPGEIAPHNSVGSMLLPIWFGEVGDTVSFALSVSKMMEGSQGDLQYLRLVSQLPLRISNTDALAWKSYDSNRVRRGLDEYIRVGMHSGHDLYPLWSMMVNRARDPVTADRILALLMKHQATAHPMMDGDGFLAADGAAMYRDANRIRSK